MPRMTEIDDGSAAVIIYFQYQWYSPRAAHAVCVIVMSPASRPTATEWSLAVTS